MNLKELAQTLGLSQTTVSRALNGYPEVSETTRIKVQLAAERHNYRPNTRAKSLATGRAMAIGHVIPLSTQHEMVNPIFSDFVTGAGEVYSKHGYDVLLSIVPDIDEERAYRELKARGSVDGVILHGPRVDEPRIKLLNEIGLPYVVHGRSTLETAEYSWLDINNRHAFARATQFLLDLGHRRIALLNGHESMDFAYRRREGFSASLAEAGISPDPALMRSDEMTELYGYSSTCEMLDLPDPPTAVLSSSMIVTYGVRRAVEDRGMKLGREVSVITHDDDLSSLKNGAEVPIFTATRSSVREAGRKAATMLMSRIADPLQPPQTELMEVTLAVGGSTGPILAR